jgi:hypothetical protein
MASEARARHETDEVNINNTVEDLEVVIERWRPVAVKGDGDR